MRSNNELFRIGQSYKLSDYTPKKGRHEVLPADLRMVSLLRIRLEDCKYIHLHLWNIVYLYRIVSMLIQVEENPVKHG